MSEELLERLRPGYDLLTERRYAEWVKLLDADVVCRQSRNILGTEGEFHGREGAIEMMRELEEAWESIVWEPVEARVLSDGRYLVRVMTRGVARASRVPLEGSEIAHLLTVRDGLTTRVDVYTGWTEALAAAGTDA